MQIGAIIGLLFGLLIAFFAFLNTASVTINYFFGEVNASVALIVLGSAMAGALMVGLLGLVTQIRAGFTLWNFKNKSQHLEKEVESLKEQKRVLTDDLSYLQSECDLLLKEKDSLLQAAREERQEVSEEDETSEITETEESLNDI